MQDHRTALLSALATASWHLSQINSPQIGSIPVDGLQWMLTVVESVAACEESLPQLQH